MQPANHRLVVAFLAVPEITASTIYGMFDFFASAGRDWAFLTTGKPGEQWARPLVVTVDGARFRAANGVWLQPDCALDACPAPDIVCVPEIFVAPDDDITGRYAAETQWLTKCYEAGATVAAACSGAVLLAEAGLLDGQDATTHWGYCDVLAARYPAVKVQRSRVLVASGDEQRIVTAGGGTSWQDLALYLVARVFGPEEAIRLAKIYLMDWHQNGQLPFAALARSRQIEDREIAACQEWIADNYIETRPVAAMVERSGLPERSFKRRFSKVTGMSPIDYVHTIRLEEAKQLLETTDAPIEAVADNVGYEDASFFRRLFRRKVGLTPAAYRKRFGSFRKALESVPANVS